MNDTRETYFDCNLNKHEVRCEYCNSSNVDIEEIEDN